MFNLYFWKRQYLLFWNLTPLDRLRRQLKNGNWEFSFQSLEFDLKWMILNIKILGLVYDFCLYIKCDII